jgi:membrane-associated phospholipid phosphatase
MLQHIIDFDRHLFYQINHGMTNPFFDAVMPWLRTARNWIPLYVLIAVFCLWKYRFWGLAIMAGIGLSAGFADFTSASIIKPEVHRARPCQDVVTGPQDIVRVGCGGFGFPSTHATDHFAMAFFMSMVFRKRWRWVWLWALLWAALISFAQVYVGVHFPADVFCGAIYGCLCGWLVYWVYRQVTVPYRFEV